MSCNAGINRRGDITVKTVSYRSGGGSKCTVMHGNVCPGHTKVVIAVDAM